MTSLVGGYVLVQAMLDKEMTAFYHLWTALLNSSQKGIQVVININLNCMSISVDCQYHPLVNLGQLFIDVLQFQTDNASCKVAITTEETYKLW